VCPYDLVSDSPGGAATNTRGIDRRRLLATLTLLIGIAAAARLVWAFSNQIALARQMLDEARRLEQELSAEEARVAELESQLEMVQTDVYVERWARERARMARPGEIVIIPVGATPEGPAPPSPTPALKPPPEEDYPPFLEQLWRMLLGLADE
jgi:cell division protein FtsB